MKKSISIIDALVFGFQAFLKKIHIIVLMAAAFSLMFLAFGFVVTQFMFKPGTVDIQGGDMRQIAVYVSSILLMSPLMFFYLGLYRLGLQYFDTGKATIKNIFNVSLMQVIRYLIGSFLPALIIYVVRTFSLFSIDQFRGYEGILSFLMICLLALFHARFRFFAPLILDDKDQSIVGSFLNSFSLTMGHTVSLFVFFLLPLLPSFVFKYLFTLPPKISFYVINGLLAIFILGSIFTIAQSYILRKLQGKQEAKV